MQELNLEEGTGYRLSIRMKCGEKGIFRAVYQQKQKPWTAAGLVKEWKLEPGTHELETAFTALPRNGAPAHLTLNFSRMPRPDRALLRTDLQNRCSAVCNFVRMEHCLG